MEKLSIKKNILCYATGFLLTKSVSLFILPVYINLISKEDYAYLTFLITLISLLSLLTDLGLNNGIYRYIKNKKRDVLILGNSILISLLINTLTVTAVLFIYLIFNIFPYKIYEFDLVLLLLSLIFSSFSSLNLTYLRVKNEAMKFMLISIFNPIIHLFGLSILYVFDCFNVHTIILSTCITNFLGAIIVYIINKENFMIVFRKKTIKRIIKYTIGTQISILSLYILTGMDKFYLSYIISPSNLAEYSLIMIIASIVILIMEPISLWYFANRFYLLKKSEKIFAELTSCLVILNIWIATFIFINGQWIYDIMSPESYTFNILLFGLAVLSFHLKYSSTILNIGCYIGKDTFMVSKITFGTALIVMSSYILFAKELKEFIVITSVVFGYGLILYFSIHFSNKKKLIKYNKIEIILNYFVSIFVCMLSISENISILEKNVLLVFLAIIFNYKILRRVYDFINIKEKNKRIKSVSL